jgi:hypothetical protein
MGLILGFLMGLLASIIIFGLLVYWLCSQPSRMAVAKFINGIAQALAHRKSVPDGAPSGEESDSTEDSILTRNAP